MSLPARRDPAVYLNCPQCGLAIAAKVDWLVVEHCPRCLARRRKAVRLFASTLPAHELYAPELAPNAERPTPRSASDLKR